jgi:hypothetical protein
MRMLRSCSLWIASKGCVALVTVSSEEEDVPGVDVDGLVFRICFVLLFSLYHGSFLLSRIMTLSCIQALAPWLYCSDGGKQMVPMIFHATCILLNVPYSCLLQ